MNSLKKVSDSELVSLLKEKVMREREATLEVLELMREVYERRLYLERGYGSLHSFVVKELGYSDEAASRRIRALRLCEEVPEVKEQIRQGGLSLSVASQLQGFFQAEKRERQKIYSQEEKRELLQKIQNSSCSQVERTLKALSPESVRVREKKRFVSGGEVEMKLVVSAELVEQLDQLKALLSHRLKKGTTAELLEVLVEEGLEKFDPVRKEARRNAREEKQDEKRAIALPGKLSFTPVPELGHSGTSPRLIPAAIRARVLHKAGYRCSYIDPITQNRCQSRHQLEVDHIRPVAFGGGAAAENLRVLCKSHNIHAAFKTLGPARMHRYFRP